MDECSLQVSFSIPVQQQILFKLLTDSEDELMLEQAKLIVFVCNRLNKQQNLLQASNNVWGNEGSTGCLRRDIEAKLKELVGDSLWSKAESFTQIYLNQRHRKSLQQSNQQEFQAQRGQVQQQFQDYTQRMQTVPQMAQQSDDAIKRAICQLQFPAPHKTCFPFEPVPIVASSFSNRAEV